MAINRIDPVAQSFFIEEPTYITKVDLFFQTKDENIPVFVQIRKNKNDRPGDTALPFSAKMISAANVNISSNANVATTVTFDSPVFCDIGEYSLALGSDSRAYNAYVAELNQTDTLSGRRISEQPMIGSLFLSENLRLFQPDLFEDLKVNIYRAKFNTASTGSVQMDLVGTGVNHTDILNVLEVDPLEVYPEIKTMKVYQFNHGYVNDSFVRFRNVANANALGTVGNVVGMPGTFIQDIDFQVANVRLDSYTVTLPIVPNVRERTRFGGELVNVEENVGFSSITPQLSIFKPANTVVTSKAITTVPGASYTIGAFEEVQNAVQNDFDSARVIASGKNQSRKTANTTTFRYKVEMSSVNDRVSPVIDLEQLGINFKRNLANEPSYANLLKHEFDVTSNTLTPHRANIIKLSNNIGVITLANVMDQQNANALVNGTFLNVTSNHTTVGAAVYNQGIYRVLDVIDGGANIKVAKLTGNAVITTDEGNANVYSIVSSPNFISEEAAAGGSSFSKYISRQVDFFNPSTGAKFFLDVSKPASANVQFYVKTKLAGDTKNMDEVEYTRVDDVDITTSLGGEFVQYEQEVLNLPEFNSLIFKIVLNSTDESQIPKIKNLRVIALQW